MRHLRLPERGAGRRALRASTGAVRPRQRHRPALGGARRHALHARRPAVAGRRHHQAGRRPGSPRSSSAWRTRSPTSRSRRPRTTWSRRSPPLHGGAHGELPLLFVRVREAEPDPRARRGGSGRRRACSPASCCPSSPRAAAPSTCSRSTAAEREAGVSLLAMPVLESGAVLYAETRVDELTRLRALLHRDRRRILAVRIGATDLCALYGLRRSPDLTIYDVKVVVGADRRRRQRARPRRRHRVHRDRAGLGVLRRRTSASSSRSCGRRRSTEHDAREPARPAGLPRHRRADPRGRSSTRPTASSARPPSTRATSPSCTRSRWYAEEYRDAQRPPRRRTRQRRAAPPGTATR